MLFPHPTPISSLGKMTDSTISNSVLCWEGCKLITIMPSLCQVIIYCSVVSKDLLLSIMILALEGEAFVSL